MIYQLLHFVFSIFNAFSIYRMVCVFCGKPYHPAWIVWSGYALYFTGNTLLHLFLPQNALLLLVDLLLLLGISCLHSTGWRTRITGAFFVFFILLAVEVSLMLLLGLFEPNAMDENDFALWGLVIIYLAVFAVTMLLEQFQHARGGGRLHLKNGLPVMATPLLSMGLLFVLFPLRLQSSNAIAAVLVMLLTINFMVVFLYDALSKQALLQRDQAVLETEKTAYEKQLELMRGMNENLTATRHDLKNHLIALQGFAEAGDTAGILGYIGQMTGQLRLFEKVVDTGNPSIDSICNFKAMQARENGIQLIFNLQIPPALTLTGYDAAIILGNLLDNAMEFLEKNHDEKQEIGLQIKLDKGGLLLRVSNPCQRELPAKESKTGRYESGKKGKPFGMGLRNVEKVVERYDGNIELEVRDGIFCAFVVLQLGMT